MNKRTAIFAKGIIIALTLIISTALSATAQDGRKKRHFSPEEFQAKQREYITEKAGLTEDEANAFFPLYFELQKKKFELEHNARKDINKKRGEKMSEEQCLKYVNNMADAKIEIAKLEKEYTGKYLKLLPAEKILRIQHAEMSFQRDLMKKMMRPNGGNKKERK